jgi:hypothetical protein
MRGLSTPLRNPAQDAPALSTSPQGSASRSPTTPVTGASPAISVGDAARRCAVAVVLEQLGHQPAQPAGVGGALQRHAPGVVGRASPR